MSTILNSVSNRRDFDRKLDVTKINSAKTDFFTTKAWIDFIQWQKVFTEAPILYHLDLQHYIQIETDALGYAIRGVLSWMTSDQ